MTATHTQGPIRIGTTQSTLVSDAQGPGVRGYDDPAYGGFMVAESVHPDNARRLAACWNAFVGATTEAIEELGPIAGVMCDPAQTRIFELEAERDALLGLLTELMDTELAEIACTGSYAPVEDLLGRIKDTADRVRQDIARGSRQSTGKLPG